MIRIEVFSPYSVVISWLRTHYGGGYHIYNSFYSSDSCMVEIEEGMDPFPLQLMFQTRVINTKLKS